MKLRWTREVPTKEGWYFWRRAKNMKDPWHWSAIFLAKDGSMSDGWSWWEGGMDIRMKRGGWWAVMYREQK